MNPELRAAVEALDDATNSTLVGPKSIREAFIGMHSHLLNQLILGLLWVCTNRQGDGRIDARIQKLAMEIWG